MPTRAAIAPNQASEAELARVRALVTEIRACRACAGAMEPEPRPVVRLHPDARILVVGQAPGVRVHAVGAPFVDASGERLRSWMGVGEALFYDARRVAIAPVGFCFPGLDAKGGDLPPRPECAPLWRARVAAALPRVALTLLVGVHAHRIGLGGRAEAGMAATVRSFAAFLPRLFPLPHPSWRNAGWIKRNPWFDCELIPALRAAVADALR
jgi:uracil-DNA glycosylase